MSRKTRTWAAFVAIALAALGAAVLLLRPSHSDPDEAWLHAQATGLLRVGLDASYPPFEYVDEHNQIVGFDVDLAVHIAQHLDLEVTFVNIAYDGLFDSLLTGQVELLISALPAVPDLQGKALFSVPYFNAGERLVVPLDSPLAAMQELEGKRLAVEFGSGGDVEARQWERRLSSLTVLRYPDAHAALSAVADGQADAALVDGISARLAVGQYPDLALSAHVTDILFAAAVHPDSLTLKARLDEAITAIIQDGTLDGLIEKWFGPQR